MKLKKILQVSMLAMTVVGIMTTPAFAESPKNTSVSEPSNIEMKTFSQIVEPLIGSSYVPGGKTEKGFDASGFTQYVLNKKGIKIPRTTEEQRKEGATVEKLDIVEGDLVFFKTTDSDVQGSHVGISLGKNQVALVTIKKGVTIIDIEKDKFWSQQFVAAKRIN